MKHLFLLLFLGLHLAPLLAQTEGEETIDFEVEFKNRFFLDTLVNTDSLKFDYGIMAWQEVVLVDSLDNKLGGGGIWSRGNKKHTIPFKNIKKTSVYYLKYSKHGSPNIIDTITLARIQEGKFIIDLHKEESERMAKFSSFTILKHLNVGDNLTISVKSYPSPDGRISITKQKNKYTAMLSVNREGTKVKAYNDKLSSEQIQMIKAFDVDSRRTFRNGCHDIEQRYKIYINEKIYREVKNDCRQWRGFPTLVKGLFDI